MRLPLARYAIVDLLVLGGMLVAASVLAWLYVSVWLAAGFLSLFVFLLFGLVAVSAIFVVPRSWLPTTLKNLVYRYIGETAYRDPPDSRHIDPVLVEPFCLDRHPDWRKRQTIEGVSIEESSVCDPDNPAEVAAFVKGTNNISMHTLMQTRLTPNTVLKENDVDGDGDPDEIHIRFEVVELNGHSPDDPAPFPAYAIAPGVQPGLWVFAPKSRGMATENFASENAHATLRAPSPVIRIEQGDRLRVTLEIPTICRIRYISTELTIPSSMPPGRAMTASRLRVKCRPLRVRVERMK